MSTDLRQLSEREIEILGLVATGLSNQQIANRLGVSINTVKVHLRNIFSKIGATSRTEATLYAVRTGLVTLPTPPYQDASAKPLVDLDTPPAAPPMSETLDQAMELSPTADELLVVEERATPIPELIHPPTVEVIGDEPAPAASAAPIAAPRRLKRSLVVGLITGSIILAGFLVAWWSGGLSPLNDPTSANSISELNGGARWKALTNLNTPRSAFGIASVNDQIFVIGGENQTGLLASVERYDVRSGTWTVLSAKPTPVTDIRAIVVGGKIYVPGGRLSAKMTDISRTFERYDPRAESWEKLPDLPEPRSGYALAALEGKIYVFGGWDGTAYRREVFEYDPERGAWSEGTPMPTARAFSDASASEDTIYVLGGENESAKQLATNEVYIPSREGEQPWSKRAPMPQPRSRFGSTVALSIIHVVGGVPSPASPLKYNARTDNWQAFEAPPRTIGSEPGVILVDTAVFALGGKLDATAYASDMQQYQALYSVLLPRQ